MVKNYYWPTFYHDVKTYIQGYDVYLAFKAACHKLYGNLYLLPMLTYCWKDLLINFVTGLPLFANWKGNNYNSILVIVKRLNKIVYYKPVKVIINTLGLADMIIDVVGRYYNLPDFIISDQRAIFTSKFWFLLYYFLGIKQYLSIVFHPQPDG